MKIKRLDIQGLYGIYDYTINFNSDITIITGFNGLGKTSILRLINYIMDGNMYMIGRLKDIFFNKLRLTMEDGSYVNIDNIIENLPDYMVDKSHTVRHEYAPSYVDCDGNTTDTSYMSPYSTFNAWHINDFRRDTVSFRDCKEGIKNKILLIKDKYNTTLSSISTINTSNSLLSVTEDKFKSTQEEYKKIIYNFQSVGVLKDTLIDNEVIYDNGSIANIIAYNNWLSVLKAYSKVEEEVKLLLLYKKLLTELRFVNKSVVLDSKNGLRFKSDDSEHTIIEIESLSSGEQNQVVMLYELIFNKESDYLITIDEPENSLHVAWQMLFYNTVEKLVKLKKYQVVIATHSPNIINSRWDKTVDLYEQYSKRNH